MGKPFEFLDSIMPCRLNSTIAVPTVKAINDIIERRDEAMEWSERVVREDRLGYCTKKAFTIAEMEKEMYAAAKNLEFEKAALLRDKIKRKRGQAAFSEK